MRASLSILMVGAALAGAASCDEVSFPTPAAEEFQATLAGANESPPVASTASAAAMPAPISMFRLFMTAATSYTVVDASRIGPCMSQRSHCTMVLRTGRFDRHHRAIAVGAGLCCDPCLPTPRSRP